MAKMKSELHSVYKSHIYYGLTLGRAKKIMTRAGANSMTRGNGRISFYHQEAHQFIGDFWFAGRGSCEESKSMLIIVQK